MKKITSLLILLIGFSVQSQEKKTFISKSESLNSAQSAFVTTLLAVTYFIFEVISPQRIDRESRKLQSQVDPEREETNK